MPRAMEATLIKNYDVLQSEYDGYTSEVAELQDRLRADALPALGEDMCLDEHDKLWAHEWIDDNHSTFRFLRRNSFDVGKTFEALRDVLKWRLLNLPRASPVPDAEPFVKLLPPPSADPLGRPILILRATDALPDPQTLREQVLWWLESLRLHLRKLNDARGAGERPALQYAVIIDVAGVSMRYLNTELVAFCTREVSPRYPGMFGVACMARHTWAHSGMWSMIKRLLPASALARIFFPSEKELVGFFGQDSLPQEYGGRRPPVDELPNVLREYAAVSETHSDTSSENSDSSTLVGTERDEADADDSKAPPPPRALSRTSLLNPYFGYPVHSSDARVPHLRHGRRRKRDLLRTLFTLWWMRWRGPLRTLLFICVLLLCARPFGRRLRQLLRRP